MASLSLDDAAVESLADFAAAQEDWCRLAGRSDNVFSTWEWAELWWRHFGTRGSLTLARIRVGDEVVAVLPLYTARRTGLRMARLVGHGVADQLGPVCDAGHFELALSALAQAHHADLLLAERLPSERLTEAVGGSVLRDEASPMISISREGEWEAYLGQRSANFRQQVRRRARKVAGAGVRFRLVSEPAQLPTALDALIALHRARWGERSRAFAGERERFHREFAALALERHWLRLWMAEADGQPVAAWYGFRFADVDYFYQSGRDPSWDRYRVGAALLEHTMRDAFADGMREYRLLRGDEAYKQRYASETRTVGTVAFARRPAARGLVSLARGLSRAHSGRALLRRAVGG
ncbi:MAG TPA: GNAT family N-acetyltransferase [Solirubrobacteraceae bacterium]|nr:GNAT family N-acetyltransferase [Solirubrobacteraceae bacterium]